MVFMRYYDTREALLGMCVIWAIVLLFPNKHEAADMKAALEIQKKIERYRIPKQIQKDTGKKTMVAVLQP